MPIDPPTNAVAEAFGLRGTPRPLAGGQGDSFALGDAVLKRVADGEEATSVQALADRLEPHGFRIARPIPASGGSWVHDSWIACELIDGLTPAAPDWDIVIAAGRSFVEATDAHPDAMTELHIEQTRRSHRWARADRCAWGEEDVSLAGQAAHLLASLRTLTDAPSTERRVIHADLSGNVHLDPAGTPVILDLSPYVRPLAWSDAIVVADAVTWWASPLALATAFVATGDRRDLLARALVFRLVAEQLGRPDGDPAMLAPYERIVRHLTG